MPRSCDVGVTRVLQRAACVRVVGWFLLSMWVQEKQRSVEGFCCAQVDRRLKPLRKLSGQSVWQSLRRRWQRSSVTYLCCMDRCV